MPTDGVPGVFATLDAGAKRTLGVYFMYDVKQANPDEYFLIESRNPKVTGYGAAVKSYVDYLYALA